MSLKLGRAGFNPVAFTDYFVGGETGGALADLGGGLLQTAMSSKAPLAQSEMPAGLTQDASGKYAFNRPTIGSAEGMKYAEQTGELPGLPQTGFGQQGMTHSFGIGRGQGQHAFGTPLSPENFFTY